MDWVGVGEEGQGKLLLAAWVGAAWTWSRSWDVAGGCNCNGHHLCFPPHGDEAALHVLAP